MTTKLIEVLEEHGLVSSPAVERLIYELPFKQVMKIRDEVQASLHTGSDCKSFEDVFSPFNFIASASFRGDTGCGSWHCHTRKAEILARYAACFCDRVVVPLDFVSHHENASQSQERYAFARSLFAIVEMRPVIDAGIIVPVASMFHYCPLCFPHKIPEVDRILEIRKHLIEALFDRFQMSYQPGHDGTLGRVVVYGPEGYLEHGEMSFEVSQMADWLPRRIRKAKMVRLTDAQKRNSGKIDAIVNQIAIDVSAQQVYGARFNATYLTNILGEAQFLKSLHEDDRLAARTAGLCAELTHSIPLFTELPLDRVMKIRREDHSAFDSYRVTLSKMLKDHIEADKSLTETEARELYDDLLRPEILNLEQQAKNERNRALKESAINVGITAGVIALGAYSGLLPAQLSALCTAVGGVKLVTDLAKSVAQIEKNPTKVRNSNLYFLLRLRQETK